MNLVLTVTHGARSHSSITYQDALGIGYPAAVVGAAAKSAAMDLISRLAEQYRAKLAPASAGKLAEYRIKEEIARDPASATPEELAMIDREAAARGTDQAALLASINTKAAAYRQIALLIGALEAEAGAAITAIPDDAADIETQIHTVLGSAKAQAETAFVEALALINGGA